jgi:hypothetical protein
MLVGSEQGADDGQLMAALEAHPAVMEERLVIWMQFA